MTTASTRLSSRLRDLASVCAPLTPVALAGCGTRLTPTVACVGGLAIEVVETGTGSRNQTRARRSR